jgi:hypothetical protein
VIDTGADMDPVTARARAFQFVELGETGADEAGGSRAAAHVLFRNALREAPSSPLRRADSGGGAARRAETRTSATSRSSAIPTNRGSTAPTRGAARTCC